MTENSVITLQEIYDKIDAIREEYQPTPSQEEIIEEIRKVSGELSADLEGIRDAIKRLSIRKNPRG